jgi:hypothetical protein
MISASFALFQKSGAKVFSSSLVISMSLASTSKIPPQRTKALHNTFNLFGSCHKLLLILFCKNIKKIAQHKLRACCG